MSSNILTRVGPLPGYPVDCLVRRPTGVLTSSVIIRFNGRCDCDVGRSEADSDRDAGGGDGDSDGDGGIVDDGCDNDLGNDGGAAAAVRFFCCHDFAALVVRVMMFAMIVTMTAIMMKMLLHKRIRQ